MPILYTSKNNNDINMKSPNEITQIEAQYLISTQGKYEFTAKDAQKLVDFVRAYIDPNQGSCSSCGASLRTAKDKSIKYYKSNKDIIDNISQNIITETLPSLPASITKLDEPILVPQERVTQPVTQEIKSKKKSKKK